MTPATAAARRATVERQPSPSPSRHRRARLRVVGQRKHQRPPRPLAKILAVAVVCASLLSIVVGHALLAQGQLKMGQIETQLVKEKAINRSTVLGVSELETPARISQEAGAYHLVPPTTIVQLPSVSLNQALPPLKIAPASGT